MLDEPALERVELKFTAGELWTASLPGFFLVLPAESSADSCFLLPTLVFITQRSRFQKAPR